jgi:site-specific DNA recombinase
VAGVYVRVSTEDQAQKYSLDAQLEACRRRALELGATEVLEFSDPGISGELLERPGLGRLRDAVGSGRVDLLVALDPDRLARKLGLQIALTEELERAGCRLDFVEFEWKNTAEGQLYYHMRGAFAQYEKAKIKRRTAYGRVQKARRGQLPLRFQPYGYTFDAVDDTLRVNEAEAVVVREMFRCVVEESMGPNAIARRLQLLGVPTPAGAVVWYRSTVARMLRNPVYTGRFLANRYDTTGMGLNRQVEPAHRVRPKLRPEAEWIAVPVPALLEAEVWERAQAALYGARRLWGGRGRSAYLLSGRMVCGECGAPMHGCRTYRRYYTCRSSDGARRTGCGHWVPADPLEQQVWAAVWKAVFDPVSLREAYQAYGSSGVEDEVAWVDQALVKKERARQAFLLAMARGDLAPGEAAAALGAIHEELEALRARRAALGRGPLPRGDDDALAGGVAGLEAALMPEERKALIRQVVERLVVGRSGTELQLRLDPVATCSAEPILRAADADEDHERRMGLLLAQPDHAGTEPDR